MDQKMKDVLERLRLEEDLEKLDRMILEEEQEEEMETELPLSVQCLLDRLEDAETRESLRQGKTLHDSLKKTTFPAILMDL